MKKPALSAQRKAVERHRRRRRALGVVRVEVQAPRPDAQLIRDLAAALRGEPARANALRARLRAGLKPAPRKDRGLLAVLACDLPDEVFDWALARTPDYGRDVEL